MTRLAPVNFSPQIIPSHFNHFTTLYLGKAFKHIRFERIRMYMMQLVFSYLTSVIENLHVKPLRVIGVSDKAFSTPICWNLYQTSY